jgi:hypothetical protein
MFTRSNKVFHAELLKSTFPLQIASPTNLLLIDNLYFKNEIQFSFVYVKFLGHNLKKPLPNL